MQIFLSWSGPRSQKVAQLLSDWLPKVIQSLDPWISTKDIQKGSLWSEILGEQLQDMTTGIICLTKENKERPWILFEAGALAKGLSSNRVCTLLIDLEPADIAPPLSQFNHTRPKVKEDMLHLLQTLNDRATDRKLRADILENALEVHWPEFEASLAAIIAETPDVEKIPHRKNDDIMREILENTRSLVGRVNKIENEKKESRIVSKIRRGSEELNSIMSKIENFKNGGISEEECLKVILINHPGWNPEIMKKRIHSIYG
ncbi:MAG: hypothetical protein ABF443_00105 [Acetobacter malorum]